MNQKEILSKLLTAENSSDVEAVLEAIFQEYGNRVSVTPVGDRENNRGQIEIGTDPGKGIVERITNGIDAILELEHDRHRGIPICNTPREAANSWLNIPTRGLHELSPAKRREIASGVVVTIGEGDSKSFRTVQIQDMGTGIASIKMPKTILSLGESNKLQKLYVAGAFGQGGSSTFACCKYSVICSRLNSPTTESKVGFTIVYYQDLDPNQFKHGRYVYLLLDDRIFEAEMPLNEFPGGVLVRHFGYDLSSYKSPLGPSSVYGLLQRALFDPIIPIMLQDGVHKYRRVIKGSRNALNGALDDNDERGPTIKYNVPLYHVSLGEHGSIGLEYWVLEEGEHNYEPSQAYVDNKKPIVLTVNGQTHAEFSGVLIRNHSELPYLKNRLIVHVDCNNLTNQAKRNLFSSGREEVRKGQISKIVEEEIVKALKSDDQLKVLNEEAKNLTIKKKDEESEKVIKSEVARILRFHGFTSTAAVAGTKGESGKMEASRIPPVHSAPSHKFTKKIDPHDPPTYVKILMESPVEFYPEQRRYLRIETDTPSSYHNSEDDTKSRINFIITGDAVRKSGSTPLREGRMRVILDALGSAALNSTGELTIEISRPGMPSLIDKASFVIVQKPQSSSDKKNIPIPEMHWVPVEGPHDDNWSRFSWPEDITKVASTSQYGDSLIIYYSRIFPYFAGAMRDFEKRNPALAESFENRYKMWLAVHSLLLERNKKEAEDMEAVEQWEQEERVRLATMVAMIAEKEVKLGYQIPLQETD